MLCSFRGEGYLGIKVKWWDNLYYIVNIYASCSLILKHILWNDLLKLKESFKDSEWVVGGDFNAVKSKEERQGIYIKENNVEWGNSLVIFKIWS